LILIFYLRLNCLGQDRSLASLGSSYVQPQQQIKPEWLQ
jgi:hypothetical protein